MLIPVGDFLSTRVEVLQIAVDLRVIIRRYRLLGNRFLGRRFFGNRFLGHGLGWDLRRLRRAASCGSPKEQGQSHQQRKPLASFHTSILLLYDCETG